MDEINSQVKQISFELQMQKSKLDYMERLKTKQDIDAEIELKTRLVTDITEQLKQYDDDKRKSAEEKIEKLTGEIDTVSAELRDNQK